MNSEQLIRERNQVRGIVTERNHSKRKESPLTLLRQRNLDRLTKARTDLAPAATTPGPPVPTPGLIVAVIPMLHSLSLRGTDITDDGLKGLLGLRNLKRLVLSQTNVTDIGLKELAAIEPYSILT